jgi:hypothetical protein
MPLLIVERGKFRNQVARLSPEARKVAEAMLHARNGLYTEVEIGTGEWHRRDD